MNLIRLINYYFLEDEEDPAALSDYFWFYGFIGLTITVFFITWYKLMNL